MDEQANKTDLYSPESSSNDSQSVSADVQTDAPASDLVDSEETSSKEIKGADSSVENGVPEKDLAEPSLDTDAAMQYSESDILARPVPLSESLTSLQDYPTEAQKEAPAEPTVEPENITADTPLTVEEEDKPVQESELPTGEDASKEADASSDEPEDYSSVQFLKDLYANGNECITMANGSFPVNEETRAMLALFSNGRFFVVDQYRYDGRVLGFEYIAKKRRLQIGDPELVTATVLKDIYEYAVQMRTNPNALSEEENKEQARMQRDFVTVISRAAMNQVSDIHIVVADHTTVMFRVNGLMQTEMEYNKEWGESFVRAAFASADISDSNYAQNEYQAAQKLGRTPLRGSGGRLVLPKNVLGIRLQFNPIAFGTRYVVMRLLYADESNASPEAAIADLGFNKRDTDLFYQLRAIPTGIVIVSGPTGSGKSTTLQRNMIAMLQERNYETNLITVEDPPEYPIPGARQMPVTNASIEEAKDREFTKALAAALRSDPDSLMIGEIRTLSAADLAFRGALSGHNVWTTLHANTAGAILLRLKDMGVEDFKLQDPTIMRGMLAQRLFRKLCPFCRIPASQHPEHPSVQRLRNAFGDVGVEHSYLRGPGCADCDFRGVKGRIAVAEFILPDSTFLNLTLKGEVQKAQNYWINDLDGRTLRENAISQMLRGVIDIEEVERWTGFLDQPILA